MKITDIGHSMDSQTFTPNLRICVSIPMEIMTVDLTATSEAEAFDQIGRMFAEELRASLQKNPG